MADLDDIKDGKDFGINTPQDKQGFFLKGGANYDWGIKNKMSRIFNPESGRTVMLAFDHGYFQGPTKGLERIDLNILPLAEHADVLMCTRGILRSVIPPTVTKPIVMRASGGNSILSELSNETIAVDIDDAVRMGVCAMAAQVYIGAEFEHKSITNVIKLIDSGMKVGIPTLAVTGVGKDMARDARYPVPIVIAGGKKLPEFEALEMAYKAVDQGAAGVDMGRNIFQSEAPVAMIKAVSKVVHELMTPDKAFQMYNDLKSEG